jgi:hypothetical protein
LCRGKDVGQIGFFWGGEVQYWCHRGDVIASLRPRSLCAV